MLLLTNIVMLVATIGAGILGALVIWRSNKKIRWQNNQTADFMAQARHDAQEIDREAQALERSIAKVIEEIMTPKPVTAEQHEPESPEDLR